MHAAWQAASRTKLIDKIERQDAEIERQRREIARLEEERAQVERERAQLERERAQWERDRARWERERIRYRSELHRSRQKIDRLEVLLTAAQRAGFRQAAPFSKGAPCAAPRRPGRKPGPGYGRAAHRDRPRQVDERYQATLPPQCPRCGGAVQRRRVARQFQEDLPPVRPVVRQFDVEVGCCCACGLRVQGRHPLQTSDALGAASAQVGPQALALATVLHIRLGLSYAKVARLLREQFGLRITPGGLVHALHRVARQSGPSYAALRATVRGSPMVSPDETGWKVAAHLEWLWAFATPDTTVYAILPGRGFEEAAEVLGADYAGVLVRDGWAPYRRFTAAVPQTCLAHLLRRCRTLERDHGDTRWAPRVHARLQQALAVRDRHAAGTMSAQGVAVARGHLVNRFNELIDDVGTTRVAQIFAAHLAIEFPGLFTFLLAPNIDATNWRAEQALRPAVVTRKVCGGNRTWRGADTQAVLASVLQTLHLRHEDPIPVLTALLRAPRPIVPLALAQPIR